MMATAAIKTVFEKYHERMDEQGMNRLGMDDTVMRSIMSHLTRAYAQAGEFHIAIGAAKVMDDIDDYRAILDAMMLVDTSNGLPDPLMFKRDFLHLLLRIGTEAELREYATRAEPYNVIEILQHLNDATRLAAYGRELEELYFATRAEEKKKEMASTCTDYILDQ